MSCILKNARRNEGNIMQNKKEDYYEIDLLHILNVLWERVWLLILSAILAGGVAFSYAFFLVKPEYESSALFYVNNSSFSVGSTEFSISSSQLTAAQSLVDTYIVILKSRTTLEDVIDKSGVSYDYEELGKMIDASAVNNTEIFKVNVKSTDPKEAETIANVICMVLPKTISNVVDGSDVRIVDYAVMSEKRVSPSYTKYTAIGGIIGFIIVAAIIVISDMLDDMIHDTTDMTQNYDIPILAVIPNLNGDKAGNYGNKYYKNKAYRYYYKDYNKKPEDKKSESKKLEEKKSESIKPEDKKEGKEE